MLTRKGEDYLEAILNVTEDKGYARIKDIAVALDVKSPSVVEMVKKLDKMSFVVYRKYDGITLTEKGREIALIIKDRHDTLKAFLEIIKVPEKIAERDACTMEHELNEITTKQVKNLVNFVKSAPEYPQWLRYFETFCTTGKHPCEEKVRRLK
ncbi:MAG TPA: metal-dependent transcriptional regulator [Methanosarcinaceae archaeon]|nr:metal-dependent transcriptional regulator [Methanosarcinaceae archaeon]